MEWYMEAWRNTFDFSGRATRSEYWWYNLVNSAVMFVISFAFSAYMMTSVLNTQYYEPNMFVIMSIFGVMIIFGIATFIPTLSVSVRRLHDVGMSGWWLLIGLVPLLGPLYLLYKFCCDSELGENDFGPNPKGEHGYDMGVFDEIE